MNEWMNEWMNVRVAAHMDRKIFYPDKLTSFAFILDPQIACAVLNNVMLGLYVKISTVILCIIFSSANCHILTKCIIYQIQIPWET